MDFHFVGIRYLPREKSNVEATIYITPQHPEYEERSKLEDVVTCHGIELKREAPQPGWIVVYHFFPDEKKLGQLFLRESDCDQFFSYGDIPEDMEEQMKQLQTHNAVMEDIEVPGLLK